MILRTSSLFSRLVAVLAQVLAAGAQAEIRTLRGLGYQVVGPEA